jgi:ketosteroid isomerase-like protein
MLSRRVIAITMGMAFLLAGGLVASHAPAATQAHDSDAAGTPVSMPLVLIAWLDAFGVGDPEAFADLYTEDGVHEDVPNGLIATGHEEIAAAIAPAFASVSESHAEAIGGFQAGNHVAMEYRVTAVDAASGTEFSFRGVLLAELEGDLLKRTTEYFDVATILGQLGLLGPPPTTPAA